MPPDPEFVLLAATPGRIRGPHDHAATDDDLPRTKLPISQVQVEASAEPVPTVAFGSAHAPARSSRTTIALDTGVLDLRATESRGTKEFASGK